MTNMRKDEIKSKAGEINKLSEQFQLVHATYAAQEYIKNIAKELYQEKLDLLKAKITSKLERDLDTTDEFNEKIELEKLIKKKRFFIDIAYIDISDENIARVTKVDNSFIIYLASSLRDTIISEDGTLNYEVIQKVRKLMAHELGHLVLHTKELLSEESLQGSLNITDAEKEEEADLFGKELLDLRKMRNKQIRQDGGAENLF